MTNVYDLINSELDRLHKLLLVILDLESKGVITKYAPYSSTISNIDSTIVWEKIEECQKLITNSYQASDKELQAKIAEIALLGAPKNGS